MCDDDDDMSMMRYKKHERYEKDGGREGGRKGMERGGGQDGWLGLC